MSSLSVPQQQPTQSSAAPATPTHRPNVEHDNDLAPMTHSRRASMAADQPSNTASHVSASPGAPHSAAARAGLIPLPQGQIQAAAENAALIAPIDWQETDHYVDNSHADNHIAGADKDAHHTILFIGKDLKPFHIPTDMLKQRSLYFKKMFAQQNGHSASIMSARQTSFEDLDEFGMRLFMHWLSNHGKLNGPHDFHSLAHYLSLYVLARKFEIEPLENQVMDLVRNYYSTQNMTSPAYRLEYIYTYTHGPNKMRDFLISTAAFRALEDSHASADAANAGPALHKTFYAPGSYVSDSIKNVMMKHPVMAMDFIEILVKLHRCGEHDARHGLACEWHVHEVTPKCKEDNLEPWGFDGAGDEKPAAPAGPVAPTTPKPTSPAPIKVADTPKPAPAEAAKAADSHPDAASHWKSTTHRLQWEMTERALAKNDDGPFKSFGKKMKDKLHSKDDKKDDKKPAEKPKDDTPAAAPPAKK